MYNVMQFDEYSFWIEADDEIPPRVHVHRAGTWCAIMIGHEEQAPFVADERDMRRTDAGRAVWIVYRCQDMLLAHWRRYNAP